MPPARTTSFAPCMEKNANDVRAATKVRLPTSMTPTAATMAALKKATRRSAPCNSSSAAIADVSDAATVGDRRREGDRCRNTCRVAHSDTGRERAEAGG